MNLAPHLLALLLGCSVPLWRIPLRAQDAAPADRNAVNARTLPGDMVVDSPVRFPERGALPSKHPPDRASTANEATEKDYFIFRTPERSLEQIARISAEMPLGGFTAPPNDWEHLRRTRRLLTEGGELRLLALGDSIVNDTMRSGWVASLQEAYPKARIQATVYVRGGGGCQHYREEGRVAKNILPRRPDLVLVGGISQRSVDDIREVIRQVRAGLPEVEFLLTTGAFGTTDPRDEVALARAPHSGTGAYGPALRRLAQEERCGYLDLTSPWAEYIRSSKRHPHLFYRDAVHANEYGEQILAQILMAFWTRAEPVRLRIDFSKPDGAWAMPALALGQGGLQSDSMIEPHIKEIRQLRPRTIRLFLSEYYRILPDRGRYDWTRLDRELRAVRATGARPTLALAMKPPVLYPKVDHFLVHPSDYDAWEGLCEALARHCREQGFEVAAWEVCNEPDIGETGGTPHYFRDAADYNRFYTRTVTGLLRGDPDAQVGGPAVASPDSFLVEGLIAHCATHRVPLHFLSWHLYSDSPAAHAANIAKQRARLAKHPELRDVKLFVSEWNMDLMRPNLSPGFQPCFVLETMRRFAEAKLDMAAYYHIRDCFVDPMDFDWMSSGGRRFMAHWWNTMPQYSALFDHHGRVRPAWYAFRFLGQLEGPRYAIDGEQGTLRAIAGDGDGYKHLVVWRYGNGGEGPVDVRLEVTGVEGRNCRVVQLEPAASVNNIRVVHFGRVDHLGDVPLRLEPWDVRWIEIE